MKVAKLVLGILSIVFSIVVTLQSCAAGVANTLSENGEVSGSAGILVSLFLITGGIVMIATRNSGKKGGSIACIILYALGAILGFAMAGSYADLKIWAGFCLVLAVLNIISLFTTKKTDKQSETTSQSTEG